jgi:hypothetical protein
MAANINTTSSSAKYAQYVHQLLCSPPAATLLNALATSTKLTTILGLISALICSHLPHSKATDKGHMHRHHSSTASACNNHANIVLAWAKVDWMCPPHKACAVQDMFFFATLANATLGTRYTDITGAFPIWSFKSTTLMPSSCDHRHPAPMPCLLPPSQKCLRYSVLAITNQH